MRAVLGDFLRLRQRQKTAVFGNILGNGGFLPKNKFSSRKFGRNCDELATEN